MIKDSNHNLWIGTHDNGLNFLQTNKVPLKFERINPYNRNGIQLSDYEILSLYEDSNGNIWLGGNAGLWRYDGQSWTNFTKTFVGYVYEDSKRDIWTSSGFGSNWAIRHYTGTSLSLEQIKATELSVYEGMYFGILEDSQGQMWFGKLDGIYRFDGENFELKKY